jgi:hypothetical protein
MVDDLARADAGRRKSRSCDCPLIAQRATRQWRPPWKETASSFELRLSCLVWKEAGGLDLLLDLYQRHHRVSYLDVAIMIRNLAGGVIRVIPERRARTKASEERAGWRAERRGRCQRLPSSPEPSRFLVAARQRGLLSRRDD